MNGDSITVRRAPGHMAVALVVCLMAGCSEHREEPDPSRSPTVSLQQEDSAPASVVEVSATATVSNAAQTRPPVATQPAGTRERDGHDPLNLCPDVGPFDDVGKIEPEEITGLKDALEHWKND